MARFFPHHTVEWRVHEPAAFRRLSLSIVFVALSAGLFLRLYRLLVLSRGPIDNIWGLLGAYALGILILLGLATAHLGNYPVRHWLWRAPVFGLVESAAFMATSAALVAGGIERVGTEAMHWHDWRADLVPTIVRHTVAVCAFAGVLAAVVQAVRFALLRRAHRDHTAR